MKAFFAAIGFFVFGVGGVLPALIGAKATSSRNSSSPEAQSQSQTFHAAYQGRTYAGGTRNNVGVAVIGVSQMGAINNEFEVIRPHGKFLVVKLAVGNFQDSEITPNNTAFEIVALGGARYASSSDTFLV